MAGTDLVPDHVARLVPYVPGKPIEELERELGIRGAVKLASNENPIGPSPRAVRALRAALGGIHRYPDGGCYLLKRALAVEFGMDETEVIVGNGSNELIELAVRTFVRPGEEVATSATSFVVYPLVAKAAGARCVEVPLKGYRYDMDGIAAAVTRRTRMVLLANPNNPTGTYYTRSEWRRFLCRVPAETIVVADEAYIEYAQAPDVPNSLEDQSPRRRLLTLRTFSKVHGLAGLRVGYGLSRNRDLIEFMNRVRQPFNVNSLAQVAAVAALRDRAHLRAVLGANRTGRRQLERGLGGLGLEVVPSQANFVLVGLPVPAAAVYGPLLERGVIVRPMGGMGLARHIRITVGLPRENERTLAALGEVLARVDRPEGAGAQGEAIRAPARARAGFVSGGRRLEAHPRSRDVARRGR